MSAYVSLEALKDAIGLSDTVDDGVLRPLIFRASAAVDSFLSQHRLGYVGFAASSNAREAVGSNTRLYDGDGSDWLWIDDASSVASVTVDDVAVDTADYTTWPYNETPKRALVYKLPASSLRGLTPGVWSGGTANVAVTGYFGINNVPPDVEQTTLAVALVYWRRYQKGEPEPTTRPAGVRGFMVDDPEINGLLTAGLQGWITAGVLGG